MNGRLNRTPYLSVASLLVAIATGCGGTGLVEVTGMISVDGKPAEGAVLIFHPEGAGSVASGAADSNGKYKLVSSMTPGVAPGKYKVTATWPDPSKKPSDKEIMMGVVRDAPDLLKSKYVSLDRTTLTAEISSSTRELPPFDLKTK
jgi:hypothetical protein